ncbi:glucose-6-phosphate 1-epimerase [Colwellia chukchiensis]|uniref:Putative glucose-6-phosphate 1-epimerase n=1 Tax=Colwellia chukchiensis TaxID=641665 RepID=A0A1H7JAX6_9GAMM|nr:D-hexose-6-phosphate mutarotase [Colwellia chukchiensis]SEK70425.1 glucose-6-phosphate 1-epimerase [Colwellia chukchiensis]
MPQLLLENEFGRIEQFLLGDGLQALRFVHQKGQGTISLYAGQVLTWQPHAQQPVFWLSKDSAYRQGKAIRGGIPICWPWFGDKVKLADGSIISTSNHGFARQSQWQLDAFTIAAEGVSITLSLRGEQLSKYWPGAFQLRQNLQFSEAFSQQLSITNLSPQPVAYTCALHSYFCVGHAKDTNFSALNHLIFDDKVTGKRQQRSPLVNCQGPIDRIYHREQNQQNNLVIVDHQWQREIAICSDDCQQWVLWNPGVNAQAMTDIHAQGENEFVCLEAANTQWQTLASQATRQISQVVKVNQR